MWSKCGNQHFKKGMNIFRSGCNNGAFGQRTASERDAWGKFCQYYGKETSLANNLVEPNKNLIKSARVCQCNVGWRTTSIEFQLGTSRNQTTSLFQYQWLIVATNPQKASILKSFSLDRGRNKRWRIRHCFLHHATPPAGDIQTDPRGVEQMSAVLGFENLKFNSLRKAKHETGRDSWQARAWACWAEQHRHWYDALVKRCGRLRATTVMQCGTMQVLDMIQPVGWTTFQRQHSGTITGRKRRNRWPAARLYPGKLWALWTE